MNFFPQPCEFPRVSTRKRVPQLRGASRESGSLTPSSLNSAPRLRPDRRRGLTPRYCVAAFTLIELMAATTVLSVILLMMVGMQDQMSKAWSNSNRRTDATREARAACRLMAQDLSGLVVRRTNNDNATPDSIPAALLTNGVPFLYSSNGLGPTGGEDLIPLGDSQSSASYFFGISSRKASGTNSGDLAIVGYYIASATTTNVNGFTSTTYNLYRHYVPASNAVNNLNAWFSSTTKDATNLFNPTNPEILARNTCQSQNYFLQ